MPDPSSISYAVPTPRRSRLSTVARALTFVFGIAAAALFGLLLAILGDTTNPRIVLWLVPPLIAGASFYLNRKNLYRRWFHWICICIGLLVFPLGIVSGLYMARVAYIFTVLNSHSILTYVSQALVLYCFSWSLWALLTILAGLCGLLAYPAALRPDLPVTSAPATTSSIHAR